MTSALAAPCASGSNSWYGNPSAIVAVELDHQRPIRAREKTNEAAVQRGGGRNRSLGCRRWLNDDFFAARLARLVDRGHSNANVAAGD